MITAGVAGLLAAAVGVCCALPVLVAAGAVGAIAGLSSGGWVLIAVGVATVVVGVGRRYRRRRACESESSPALPGSRFDEAVGGSNAHGRNGAVR